MDNSTSPERAKLKSQAVELLKKMIATPSVSRDEEAVAVVVETHMRGQGLDPRRFLKNVWLRSKYFDPKKPTLLLNSHIDTVKPNSGYTLNPHDPVVRDGKLYGLGSNDAGGCVVGLLSAFMHFCERSDLKYNLIYASTAEEEISGLNGVEALLPHLREKLGVTPDCAMVGEPTGMQMAVAEKGLMVLDCIATGRSGHAARDEGDNAIYKAVRDIEWFKDYRYAEVSPLLGPNKMTVTMIESGTQHNVVPRECKFVVDVRVNELYDFEKVVTAIKGHVQSEIRPRGYRLKSTSIALDHPLVKAGTALGRAHYGSPTTSDKALMPFPALKMGPGESGRSHTADEYILIKEIEDGIDLYISLLEKVLT
ncbi:MAG: M20 family metallo-hydrolase [Bdellovibrionales bacterium]|nr:M20 family metallo-hydrolase [Bdellovibrionales bacterium]